jgi:hypothetical protein
MPDVMAYSITALTSVDYVEPTPEMSKRIIYEILYEELKKYCNATLLFVFNKEREKT